MAGKRAPKIEVSAGRVVVDAERVRVVFSLDAGTFTIEDPAGQWSALENATATVQLNDRAEVSSASGAWTLAQEPRRFEDAHGGGTRVQLTSDARDGLRLHIELCAYDERSLVLLRVGVENGGSETQHVRALSPLEYHGARASAALRPPASRWRWFRHGWQSWTPSLALTAAQRDIEVRPPVSAPAPLGQRRGELASDEVAVLLDAQSGRSLLAGFVSARQQWTQVQLDAAKRSLRAVAFADGVPLAPGETMWSERLLLEFADEPEAALQRYADAVACEMGARVPAASPAGWCSWYYYFTTVSEQDVLHNLRFVEQHRRELPVQLVQIDDGYQADIGDWTTTNEKFPRGMAPLARDITDAGFAPGIWLAPLLAGETSRLYAEHPDWVISDDGGEPALAMHNWNQRCFGLDCSNPDVERWLRELFREVTDGWGYEYVKIDFLYGAAIAGRRHDERSTRVDSYRRGLAAIRSGVGDKRFVLGCGALMGASVGVIDAQRIGPDVAPWWRYRPRGSPVSRGRLRVGGEPATDNAIRNILTRAWMHGRLWTNDPDCLLARQTRTKLSLAEVQTLATAIALSGGAVFLSDDMEQLSPERLDLVSSLLPPIAESAAVSDLMREAMPSTMTVDITRPFESWHVVGRFNWAGRGQDLSLALPPGRWHVFEFWEGRYHGVHEGELLLGRVAPHGVRLLSLRKALDRPQVVGSTFHYSMGAREIDGARWDQRQRTLRINLVPVAKREGELFVHAPEGYRFARATVDGEDVAVRFDGQLLVVHLAIDKPSLLAITFA
jgi:alpha-galactosidase